MNNFIFGLYTGMAMPKKKSKVSDDTYIPEYSNSDCECMNDDVIDPLPFGLFITDNLKNESESFEDEEYK